MTGESRELMLDVVIPAYKSERWLAGAVRSALTVDGVRRVVVIDDGSPTAQESAARDGLGTHDPVRLFVKRQDNTGPAGARNRGIDRCLEHPGGAPDWVVFLDADDELAPGVIDAACEGERAHAAIVAAARIEFYDDGREKPKLPPAWARPGAPVRPGLVHKPHGVWTGSGIIASRRALDPESGGRARFADDLIVVEDLDFYRRCGEIGPIVTSDAVALRRRLFDDGGNLTSPGNLTRWAHNLCLLCDRWHTPEDNDAWRECMTWMLNQLAKHRLGHSAEAGELRTRFAQHGWRVPMKIRLRSIARRTR